MVTKLQLEKLIATKIPADLYKQITRMASRYNKSRAEIARQMLSDAAQQDKWR